MSFIKMKMGVNCERHGCLLWRLPVPYQRMRTRTGVKEMNKEELLKQPMVVCTFCGWEIARSAVWIEPVCDDCAMDKMIQHNREQGISNE